MNEWYDFLNFQQSWAIPRGSTKRVKKSATWHYHSRPKGWGKGLLAKLFS